MLEAYDSREVRADDQHSDHCVWFEAGNRKLNLYVGEGQAYVISESTGLSALAEIKLRK